MYLKMYFVPCLLPSLLHGSPEVNHCAPPRGFHLAKFPRLAPRDGAQGPWTAPPASLSQNNLSCLQLVFSGVLSQ